MSAYTPLTGKQGPPAHQFEIDDPMSENLGCKPGLFRRYRTFLQRYKYPRGPRALLTIWYAVNIYSIIVVLGYSCSRTSSFTMSSSDPNLSWLPAADKAIKVFEDIAPGSTQDISSALPDELSFGQTTYYIYHFGICRENKNLERVCYGGEGMMRLIAEDIASQVAESNGVDDRMNFISSWKEGYQSALSTVAKTIEDHTVCDKRSLWNLFLKKCVVKDIDPSSLQLFQEFLEDTKRSLSTKLWMALALLSMIILSLDLFGLFVKADESFCKVPWSIAFSTSFVLSWMYLFSLSTRNPILLADSGIVIKEGILGFVYSFSTLLQLIIIFVVGILDATR